MCIAIVLILIHPCIYICRNAIHCKDKLPIKQRQKDKETNIYKVTYRYKNRDNEVHTQTKELTDNTESYKTGEGRVQEKKYKERSKKIK